MPLEKEGFAGPALDFPEVHMFSLGGADGAIDDFFNFPIANEFCCSDDVTASPAASNWDRYGLSSSTVWAEIVVADGEGISDFFGKDLAA